MSDKSLCKAFTMTVPPAREQRFKLQAAAVVVIRV